jgi:hypothetical protein
MHNRQATAPDRLPDVLTLAAATWLACGVVLYGLTPLPWRDATLGWSPVFWLLVAPSLLLLTRRLCMSRPHALPAAHCGGRPSRGRRIQAVRRREGHTSPRLGRSKLAGRATVIKR